MQCLTLKLLIIFKWIMFKQTLLSCKISGHPNYFFEFLQKCRTCVKADLRIHDEVQITVQSSQLASNTARVIYSRVA